MHQDISVTATEDWTHDQRLLTRVRNTRRHPRQLCDSPATGKRRSVAKKRLEYEVAAIC